MQSIYLSVFYSYLILWSNIVYPHIQKLSYRSQTALLSSGLSDQDSRLYLYRVGNDAFNIARSDSFQIKGGKLMDQNYWLDVYNEAPQVLKSAMTRLIYSVEQALVVNNQQFDGGMIQKVLMQQYGIRQSRQNMDTLASDALKSFHRVLNGDIEVNTADEAFSELAQLRHNLAKSSHPKLLTKRGLSNQYRRKLFDSEVGIALRAADQNRDDVISQLSPNTQKSIKIILGVLFIMTGVALVMLSLSGQGLSPRQRIRKVFTLLIAVCGAFSAGILLLTSGPVKIGLIIIASFSVVAFLVWYICVNQFPSPEDDSDSESSDHDSELNEQSAIELAAMHLEQIRADQAQNHIDVLSGTTARH
ncbi:hypothetical protein MIR68_010846 [Amoeboaphelidium protococcarum]|nr:hypothetical protein MIR68_010846 [Amoeboaphelidium protococcarum]